MESFKHTQEIIDNLKPEHLAEGINPIIACIDERDYYSDDIKLIDKNAFNVDYYKKKSLGKNDKGVYVISGIDSGDKYTDTLYNCTSVICVGVDKDTGEEISFLTHQDPKSVTKFNYFTDELSDTLMEMKKRTVEGTVDIVIAGGFFVSNYNEYIKILNKSISDVFDFSPVVISGPKKLGGYDSLDGVYFDTKNRRVYITRPKDYEKHNEPFVSDDLDKASERWKKAD